MGSRIYILVRKNDVLYEKVLLYEMTIHEGVVHVVFRGEITIRYGCKILISRSEDFSHILFFGVRAFYAHAHIRHALFFS